MRPKFRSKIISWVVFRTILVGLSLILPLGSPWLVTPTSAQEPEPYNTAFLTDEELEDFNSMTADQIQEFLASQGSYFQQPVQDVDGVTFNPSEVIAQAAVQYRINPQVLLATLQKESTGVTRSGRPSDVTMSFLMGCVTPSTARDQLTCAAERFRAYHDQLTNNGVTVSGWKVGVAKETQDGVTVTPATKAVAGQFTYTPYAGVQWGGINPSIGGVFLFYDAWNRFGFGEPPSPSVKLDVYILVDLSGSFADDLPVFKTQAPGIISTLRDSNPDSRFGLGKYEDYPIPPFGDPAFGDKAYERLVDLTFDTDLVLNTISGLFTRSGFDAPQSQLPALFQAATGAGQDLSGVGFPGASIPPGQQANFRDGATKLFLLWTDAPFHLPGDPGTIPYPGPSFSETVAAILALDPPKVIGVSSGGGGAADLQAIAAATGAFAPAGGIDCNADGITDVPEGEPLVCTIAFSGEGIAEAIIALVEAAAGPLEVAIDIKPEGKPNSINCNNEKAIVPVAILTNGDFDATTVDHTTVTFEGASETHVDKKTGEPRRHEEDVDGDGDIDLVLHFRLGETNLTCDSTDGTLTGETFDGQAIQGTDMVRMVEGGNP